MKLGGKWIFQFFPKSLPRDGGGAIARDFEDTVNCKKIINTLNNNNSLLSGARAAKPEELPCRCEASNIWNVNTGQNDLWTGLKATLCPKELLARIYIYNS